jgi:hypothetical protein
MEQASSARVEAEERFKIKGFKRKFEKRVA